MLSDFTTEDAHAPLQVQSPADKLKGMMSGVAGSLLAANWSSMAVQAKSFVNPLQFSKPLDQADALSRLRANLSQFRLLYGALYFVLLVCSILASPLLLLGVLLIGGGWGYAFVLNDPQTIITVGSYELGRKEKLFALVPGTLLIFLLSGLLTSLIWVAIYSSFLCVPHATFHNPPQTDAFDELSEAAGLPAL